MTTMEDYYKILEANNKAHKIIENSIGLDEYAKIIAQINSMPGVPLHPPGTVPSIPPAVMALKNNIASVNLLKGNQLPIFQNSTPLYESLIPALTFIHANRPELFEQVNAVLSGEIIVDVPKTAKVRQHKRKVNLHKAQGLMERSRNKAIKAYCSWSTLARTQKIHILEAIGADLLAYIDALDKPADVQLLYPIFFLIVSLILYLKSTPEALLKQENTEN